MPADPRPDGDPNPYAAPQVPDPLVDFAHLGVGVWRDGNFIVMHKDAKLPPFCVKTGQPTGRSVQLDANWLCESFRVYIVGPKLTVPLSQPSTLFLAWYRQFLMPATFGIFFICFGAITWLDSLLGQRFEVAGGLLAGALSLGLVTWAFAVGDPLAFQRSEGNYHWLSGASQHFLDRLPQWRPYE